VCPTGPKEGKITQKNPEIRTKMSGAANQKGEEGHHDLNVKKKKGGAPPKDGKTSTSSDVTGL